MPMIPAICEACETVFSSGINMEGGSATFIDCSAGPCPKCGGTGIIPDAKFSYVGDALQLIWTTRKSLDLLKRIQRIVEEAQKKNLSPDEVGEQIDENAPELSELKSVLPRTRVELYMLLTALAAMIATCQNNTNLSKSDVDQMIDNAKTEIISGLDQKQVAQAPIELPQAPNERVRPKKPDGTKLGRNDPCYCGSGKKFKHCHYPEF